MPLTGDWPDWKALIKKSSSISWIVLAPPPGFLVKWLRLLALPKRLLANCKTALWVCWFCCSPIFAPTGLLFSFFFLPLRIKKAPITPTANKAIAPTINTNLLFFFFFFLQSSFLNFFFFYNFLMFFW